MKRKTASFTGMRPIFTGSPSIVQGGFNLDVETNISLLATPCLPERLLSRMR